MYGSADLPGIFRAADAAAIDGQRRFIRATGIRLALAVAAAASATLVLEVGKAGIDVFAVATAAFLTGAVLAELWMLYERPERTWYLARAVAESAKTLAWRYAVGAAPFGVVGTSSAEVDLRLRTELGQLLHDSQVELAPSVGEAITPAMSTARASSLEDRKLLYLVGRIDDQLRWYSSTAARARKLSRRWRLALIILELVGISAALARGFGLFGIDVAGIVAAAIGAAAAWLAIRQHETTSSSYSLASQELSLLRSGVSNVSDEATWAVESADAEEAISREHVMWRASRTSRTSV